jgi:hypothetical protein
MICKSQNQTVNTSPLAYPFLPIRTAKKYASPTFQFALANPAIDADCSNLMIGDDVCLGQRGTDCNKVHVVVTGESVGVG